MSDDRKALSRGLRRRDPALLDALIEQHQYRLFRYLLYLTGDAATAEDIFQETWIRVLDRGGQYDCRARFDTWLFAIARHLVLDLQRRRKPVSLESLTGGDEPHTTQFATAEPSPLELLARSESETNLRVLLAKLPAVMREVLVLRFHEELAIEEIAEIVAAPVSTVKSRLYRGLEALRGLMEAGA